MLVCLVSWGDAWSYISSNIYVGIAPRGHITHKRHAKQIQGTNLMPFDSIRWYVFFSNKRDEANSARYTQPPEESKQTWQKLKNKIYGKSKKVSWDPLPTVKNFLAVAFLTLTRMRCRAFDVMPYVARPSDVSRVLDKTIRLTDSAVNKEWLARLKRRSE